jgi:hypothetical protein
MSTFILMLIVVTLSFIEFENQWWVGITGASEAYGCFR